MWASARIAKFCSNGGSNLVENLKRHLDRCRQLPLQRVFALGLAHKNGDGYAWAEQIANAIDVVKQRTGATQVDVVAWSKAAANARMYVSNIRCSWGTATVAVNHLERGYVKTSTSWIETYLAAS